MAYIGAAKLKAKFKKKGIKNPGGLIRKIGEEKYGKKKFDMAAAKGMKMKGMKAKHQAKALEEA